MSLFSIHYQKFHPESAPVCSSNISLSSILVDNDCSLEPDHIRLDCSVASHGNRPPVLEWRHSMDPDVIIPGDGTTSTHSVHLRPEFQWNGTNFICSIKDLQPPMQSRSCTTLNISTKCELCINFIILLLESSIFDYNENSRGDWCIFFFTRNLAWTECNGRMNWWPHCALSELLSEHLSDNRSSKNKRHVDIIAIVIVREIYTSRNKTHVQLCIVLDLLELLYGGNIHIHTRSCMELRLYLLSIWN